MMSEFYSKAICERIKPKSIAFMNVNDDWGRLELDNYTKLLTGCGIEVKGHEFYNRTDTDFTKYSQTIADFGTVQHFGVQTLTTGIFSTWLNGNNAGGAAQIAGVVLALILVLVGMERVSRRNARFHRPSRASRPVQAQP